MLVEAGMSEAPQVTLDEAARRFEVRLGGETAFAEYNLLHDAIVLPHTVVPKAFEGRGVGGALAQAALTYARDHGLKVKPVCDFMAGYIKKHPQWQELVHESFRAKLGLDG